MTAAPATKKPARVETIDIIKGIAIILVVVGHVGQGMFARGLWGGRSFKLFDVFIYSFHMPAYFLIAGLFVKQSLDKRGIKIFLIDKVKVLLYPYLLWETAGQILLPFIARFKGDSSVRSWGQFLIALIHADTSWFLVTLFVCLVMAAFSRKMPDPLRLFLAILLAYLMPYIGFSSINKPIFQFPFVTAGMWIALDFQRLETIGKRNAIAASAALFGALYICVWRGIDYGAPTTFFLGILGTFALALLSRTLEGNLVGKAMSWLGQASIAVLLISPYGQGVGRIFTNSVLHASSFAMQLLIPSTIAIIVPALIWHLQKPVPAVGWLFSWQNRKA